MWVLLMYEIYKHSFHFEIFSILNQNPTPALEIFKAKGGWSSWAVPESRNSRHEQAEGLSTVTPFVPLKYTLYSR